MLKLESTRLCWNRGLEVRDNQRSPTNTITEEKKITPKKQVHNINTSTKPKAYSGELLNTAYKVLLVVFVGNSCRAPNLN